MITASNQSKKKNKKSNLFAVINWYSFASTVAKCQEIDYLLLWKLLVTAPAAAAVILLFTADTISNADGEDFCFSMKFRFLKVFVAGRLNAFSYERSKQNNNEAAQRKIHLNCVQRIKQYLKIDVRQCCRLQHVGQVKRVVVTCF